MIKSAIAIVLATVSMYVWGFLYWGGANPLPYQSWKQTKDDVAAGKALLEHFPETGTYYLPGMNHDAETKAKLFEDGPVGFVHITARDGRPMVDPSIMIAGFVLNLIVVILLYLTLNQAAGSLPGYGSRLKLVALFALTAVVLIDCGDAIWWQIPWEWKIHVAFYNFSAFLVAGLVLSAFVKRHAESSPQSNA